MNSNGIGKQQAQSLSNQYNQTLAISQVNKTLSSIAINNNEIAQQLQQIYVKYFKPINSINDSPLFQQIDYGPAQLCPQLFSIHQNCLVINFNAFDKYYQYLFNLIKVKNHQLKQQQSTKQNRLSLLKACDIILSLNGQNDRAWNIKKYYLTNQNNIYSGNNQNNIYFENTNQQMMSINWQLGFNAAVCLKNKKSSSYYQYRLLLIEIQIKSLIENIKNVNMNNKSEQQQQLNIRQRLKSILDRQHQLINRVLGRYFRNYFCWMYRVKLIQLIVQLINSYTQQIDMNNKDKQLSQSITLYELVILTQHKNIHKFIQRYCNDYSAYSYIISLINRYYLNNNNNSQQSKDKRISDMLNKQMKWIDQLQEYCQIAYTQPQHYKHLTMYKSYLNQLTSTSNTNTQNNNNNNNQNK